MPHKHYDSSYLEDTSRILKNVKELSYNAFKAIEEGVVIDLGCGTGLDVINLSEINNSIKVVGIDHDAAMLEKAREAAGERNNVEFQQSEASPLQFTDGSIDGVRSERMIQHLESPQQVINEIHRVLKKGSPLVIVETDWANLSFYNEHFVIQQKIINYLTDVKVRNGLAAKNLPYYLETASFQNIKIELFPIVLKSLKQANDNLWIERIVEEAAATGAITEADCEAFITSLKHADEQNRFVCSINSIVLSCIK